jgi:hypothetical protein
MYFIVLSYYLVYNVFKRIKWMRLLIATCVGFFSLVFVLILIDSFIQNVKTCKGNFDLSIRNILPDHELHRHLHLGLHIRSLSIQLGLGNEENQKVGFDDFGGTHYEGWLRRRVALKDQKALPS